MNHHQYDLGRVRGEENNQFNLELGKKMSVDATQKNVIRLEYQEKDRSVLINPEDQDKFVLSVAQMIESAKLFSLITKFVTVMPVIMEKIGQWLGGHRTEVEKAFLTLKDRSLLLLVVQKQKEYNQVLQESLVNLDIEIAQDERMGIVPLSVLLLPMTSQEAIDTFINFPLVSEIDFSAK